MALADAGTDISTLAFVNAHATSTPDNDKVEGRALHSAGWTKDMYGDAQTMLTLGTAHSGVSMSMDFMDSLLDQGPRLSSPTAFSHAVNNMGAGLLSLLLGVRGSCQTVSQFSLSFAGALHTAALALHSGRARRALVGAVDETDPRFDLTTPAHTTAPSALHARGTDQHATPLAATQGAVFLCVEAARQDALTQGLRVCWGEPAHATSPDNGPAASPTLTLLSGDARPTDLNDAAQNLLCLAPHYGITPLAQALDVMLALRQDIPTVRCVCAHAPFAPFAPCQGDVKVRPELLHLDLAKTRFCQISEMLRDFHSLRISCAPSWRAQRVLHHADRRQATVEVRRFA